MTGYGFGSLYGADPGSPYFDPTAMGFAPSTPMQSAITAPVPDPGMATGNEGLIRKTLTGLGFNPTAQAGMLSNLYYESGGLNPTASPGAGHSAYGFAQWTGPRRLALQQFAADNKGSESDPNIQAQFLAHEIQTKYPDFVNQINAAKSPQEAAEIALRTYEGVNPSNATTASMGNMGWDGVLSAHQKYADAFFNGKSPTEYGDPTAHQYASAGGSDGTMDTSVDTSNMPPLTNLRALAAPAMVDPSTFGNGPQSQALQGLLQNPNIQRLLSGGGNPSATLAKMSAGFLSGNGTHSGLAAGFAGLASGEDEDQKGRLALLSNMMNNQNSLYKMGLENNMNVNRAVLQGGIDQQNSLGKLKLQQAMNAPFRQMMLFGQLNRATPTGDAAVASGLMKPDDPRVAQLNASWKSGEPVPAGVAAQSQKLVQQIQDARNVQIQAKTVADWAKSGAFQLDPVHKAMYNLANQANMGTDASSKYAAANQATASIATKLRSAFGNRMTDADLAQANAIVTGGTSSFGDNKVMGNHYDGIGNQAYQSELAARKQLQDLYTSRKLTGTLPKDANGNPDFNSLIPDLPASPYANTKVNNIGTNYWGDNTTNPGATASPQTPIGQPPAGTAPTVSPGSPAVGGVGMLKTKNGLPVTYIPPSQ